MCHQEVITFTPCWAWIGLIFKTYGPICPSTKSDFCLILVKQKFLSFSSQVRLRSNFACMHICMSVSVVQNTSSFQKNWADLLTAKYPSSQWNYLSAISQSPNKLFLDYPRIFLYFLHSYRCFKGNFQEIETKLEAMNWKKGQKMKN
mgnify:CR=1 FL=1